MTGKKQPAESVAQGHRSIAFDRPKITRMSCGTCSRCGAWLYNRNRCSACGQQQN